MPFNGHVHFKHVPELSKIGKDLGGSIFVHKLSDWFLAWFFGNKWDIFHIHITTTEVDLEVPTLFKFTDLVQERGTTSFIFRLRNVRSEFGNLRIFGQQLLP